MVLTTLIKESLCSFSMSPCWLIVFLQVLHGRAQIHRTPVFDVGSFAAVLAKRQSVSFLLADLLRHTAFLSDTRQALASTSLHLVSNTTAEADFLLRPLRLTTVAQKRIRKMVLRPRFSPTSPLEAPPDVDLAAERDKFSLHEQNLRSSLSRVVLQFS